MTTSPKLTLTVVAGPNGSGKSTFTRNTQQVLKVPVIDPDAIARLLRPDNSEAAAIAGGKQAILRARGYLEENRSFAVETTLSGNTYLKMMKEAKHKGWVVDLIYVGLDNVETSIDRVAQRVAAGGHNVPEEDIRRRYERSLANLPIALQLADNTSFYNNSTAAGYQKLVTIEDGKITQRNSNLPNWVKAALPSGISEQS